MFGTKIKVDKALYERLKKVSEIAGYSSPEEFAVHILEKEVSKIDTGGSEEDVRKRLQGLGYIS